MAISSQNYDGPACQSLDQHAGLRLEAHARAIPAPERPFNSSESNMIKIFRLALLLSLSLVSAEKFRFDDYALYKIQPTTEEQVRFFQALPETPGIDVWDTPVSTDDVVNVVLAPSKKAEFTDFLTQNGFYAEIVSDNIQELIDNQKVGSYSKRNARSMRWDEYYTLEDIYSWLDDLVAANPNVVTPIIAGTTYENREIRGVKISHGSGRKIIFIEAGIHAREWISPATVNFITNELIYSQDAEIQAAARDFDWYIFPVTNPDGYVWTHEEYRLWRKNRRPYGNEVGVDLNRNWNSNWLEAGGASTNPASNTYAGPGPFSEIEALTLSSYIRDLAHDIELYLSFHSSGQLLLIPYGNTTEPLDNYYDAIKIGRRAMGSLAVRYGTQYVTGNIAEAIYIATGTSIDWVKEKLHVPLVYCYELRDRGQYGHLLPPEQILPTSEEVMDSLVAIIREARAIGYMNSSIVNRISILSLIFVSFALIV
ncbi:Zinc carboxypeptidase A 1 [Eumeta japonica]|uniref:Zinc carboxypeptidase A 1 n=1 Tax=Eumeta variegata TaxID=151549 RepID=A0A4C2A0V1_EUMVA|nr:Zinc carboxypeptidase A 1 [Eumeta japonica]